eukprot:CAMPEP_0195517044 /NCGR_PEP_ID=MMETSP0794_2-20130614/9531_1 /TAXON_ID=515487 /ORGANISM="Stephanopyxis turris, Strain CCMP 815" /LENGTH=75 /DNA_ID=CAMNT_0040645783 /DNA_START=63 /DNA_END=290 /DNA_ORIENTATION=+
MSSDADSNVISESVVKPLKEFYKNSAHFITKCKKPDRAEFHKVAFATGVGFLMMGFIGFFVKLVHIPINQIIIGG